MLIVSAHPIPAPSGKPGEPLRLDDPYLYLNREISLLEFQGRVLEEAQDPRSPLLERLKFLAIVSSNLNEFFMVRVAGLLDQVAAGVFEAGSGELTPSEQLRVIRPMVDTLMEESRICLLQDVLPALEDRGVSVVDYRDLNDQQRAAAEAYFAESIFPVLTPLAFDPGRPFPHISNLSLNLAIVIRRSDGSERFARVKVPGSLPQLVRVSPQGTRLHPVTQDVFVWIEQLIAENLKLCFPGVQVVEAHPFHVTRDAEMEIQEIEADDLLESVAEGVRRRRFGSVVRLCVSSNMPEPILRILKRNLEIAEQDVYRLNGPLALNRLMSLYKVDRPDLKDAPIVPRTPAALNAFGKEENIFTAIDQQDVLLHHPYDSFEPVVDFLRQAARDPKVLAIKMTLYRVGRDSPVVKALLEAQENGKQVAVLVELKARFDEESNIEWARQLEEQGVHVVYGLVGLKIHSKIALVVRQEGGRIRRYVHLSTGNYNAVTANLYTDIGLLTADDQIGADATRLFNYLTGYTEQHHYDKLLVAPVSLRGGLEAMIEREIEIQRKGGEGRLIFKTNGLVDRQIIDLLYRASQAGVRCDLLVRGICCLRPGVPGVSDNIRVISVVGRYLEHSRIYYSRNGGDEEMYLGSADLMPRNLTYRVETVFPVRDPAILRHLRDDVLETYLADNMRARVMQTHGGYARAIPLPDEPAVDSQAVLARRWTPAAAPVTELRPQMRRQ
ncbi:MAG: polyphosphate kinase 1 [Bryobacterales bacterium]|nr:polyphosphate kinase 1 [Bryobacterales bacterium]